MWCGGWSDHEGSQKEKLEKLILQSHLGLLKSTTPAPDVEHFEGTAGTAAVRSALVALRGRSISLMQATHRSRGLVTR